MTTVTTKGQVTIPKPVRDFLGIVPGSHVDFQRTADGKVILIHLDKKVEEGRFEKWRGFLGDGMSTDEIMAMTRGED
jgi:antitoxin PrlF